MRAISTIFLAFQILFLADSYFGQALETYKSGPGRFKIAISTTPTIEDASIGIDPFEITGTSYTWKKDDGSWLSVEDYDVYGKDKLTDADKKNIIQKYIQMLVAEYQNKGVSTQQKAFVLGNIKGFEVSAVASRTAVTRIFFVAKKLYLLHALGNITDFDEYRRLLNSFRILSKEEYVAVRISENMPESLPQSPKVIRTLSDAGENNLKGRVKSVITYSQEKPTDAQTLSGQENYDEDGYLVSDIFYMRGYPTDLTSWGWIEGKRVSDLKVVEYGMSDGPNEQGTIMIMGMDPDYDKKPHPPRDNRFTYRYEYKYDGNGRITDWFMFQNDESLWQHRTYNYSGGKREMKSFGEDGELNDRSVDVLDKAGNPVEETSYDDKNKLVGVTVSTYVFDKIGNWVTKKQFDKTKGKGKVVLKLSSIEHRTITYY